ncbi:MAG TPA: TIGR03560 family F420-dependent LLM class oxidoreductase [Acidimicrobiales bacterium]|nr:TIGR03560 family F420-dependent LLM class oxidoreductase [Acidimicrobiales bacterium]
MRFSIWPSATQPWTDVLEVARHAEETGWDGVWIADHFMGSGAGAFPPEQPTLEAGSVVGALSAAVPRVRIGTLVYGNTYRHPAVVANMAATADHISGGRFVLGLGAGWQENEHEQYGIELPAVRERVDRFAEAVAIVRSLLREPSTTHVGDHYRLTDALCEPKPVQQPLPLLVGASGEKRMLRLVAEHADEWNCWSVPELFRHKSSVLDQHCEAVGRDPSEIRRSTQALVFVTDDDATADELVARLPRPAYGGTPARLADTVAAFADAGVDELIVPDVTLGSGVERLRLMDVLIDDVAARVA